MIGTGKRFWGVLAQDVRRAFSRRFVCSALALALLMLTDNIWELREAARIPGYTVYYLFFNSIVFSGVFSTYGSAVACAIPYCAEANREYACGIQPQFASRAGRRGYLLSKFLSAVASSGLCMACGYLLFIGALSLFFPFTGPQVAESGMDIFPYVSDSLDGRVWQHIIMISLNGFLTGAFYGGVTIAVSAYIKDRLVVLAIPFVIRFCWIQLYRLIQLSEQWRLDSWMFMLTMHKTALSTALYSTLRVTLVLLIALCIFYKKSTRRIQGLESDHTV